MTRVRWSYIVLYSAMAFAISAPFNTKSIYRWLPMHDTVASWHSWLFVPAALGPLVAAIICYRLDRMTTRRITVFGEDWIGSLLTALLPLLLFPLAGYKNGGTHGLLFTLLAGCLALLYSLGEEAGWRGYLQDALLPWNARQRYLLVGLLWWVWHMRFTYTFEWTIFPLIVIASAFVLGHVAEKTRSLLVIASMHSVVMLLTMSGSVRPAFAVAALVIILGWMLVGQLRPTKQSP